MKKLLVLAVILSATGWAQTSSPSIYLDHDSPFSADFAAALQKKNVPVTVTTDQAQAEYLVNFSVAENGGSVVKGIISSLDTGMYNSGAWNRATMQVIDTKSKNMVFSYTCKKYNTQGNDMTQSVAECLAKHWKNNLGK